MTERKDFKVEDIVLSGWWPFGEVRCSYQDVARSTCHLDRERILREWTLYRTNFPGAYDGPLLGLVDFLDLGERGLELVVRETTYSEYVATRQPSSKMPFRAGPIGLTVVPITRDGLVVTTRRSQESDQNPGMSYFVGGYAEPKPTNSISDVIFADAKREVFEELGSDRIQNIGMLGLANDPFFVHPEFFLVVWLADSFARVRNSWLSAPGRRESSEVIAVSIDDLVSGDLGVAFPDHLRTWSFEAARYLLREFFRTCPLT